MNGNYFRSYSSDGWFETTKEPTSAHFFPSKTKAIAVARDLGKGRQSVVTKVEVTINHFDASSIIVNGMRGRPAA